MLALLLAAGGAAPAAEPPVALGPCGPIERLHDAVELPGVRLEGLGGTPVSRLGLLAARAGRLVPIPVQLDERRGRKLALPEGPDPTSDDRPGVVDGEDLLVFMACDAGERRSADAVEAALRDTGGAPTWREIEIRDPLDGRTAYAYLTVSDRPPATERRYVAYVPSGDFVTTAHYRVGLVHALPTYLTLSFDGGPGPNLIDGLRLRASATLRADLAHWTLNEQEGTHELIAWKAGPVRVVRRSKHRVAVALGLQLTAGTAHTYFYPQHVFAPGSMKLPFSPGLLFRDIRVLGGADGRDLRGWRYHAPGVPAQGFLVDGHMDEEEQRFAGSGDWFVLAGEHEAVLFVARMSPELTRAIRLRLAYRDDAARPDPPETSPGTVPLVGYEGEHLERLAAGRYRFALHIYGLPGYRRGDERRLLARLDSPLTAEVTLSGPDGPAARPPAPR